MSGIVAIHARITSPLTSISHAPQLPPRHPVGMSIFASHAAFIHSTPGKQLLDLLTDAFEENINIDQLI